MNKSKKVMAIVAFATVMTTLLLAIITDIVIFSNAILMFVLGTFVSVLAFIFLVIIMIITCILIFGIYLIGEYGFWPISVSFQLYKEILADINITTQQLRTFAILRVVFLIICVCTFVLAIMAMHKDKNSKEKVPLKGMSVTALIFSILGFFTALGALVITSLAA